jgi:hypothetical protein
LCIDFGSSQTAAALRAPDGLIRPLSFDGLPVLPSAICLDTDDRLLVGHDALLGARLDRGRFEPNPKLRIDERTLFPGAEVRVVEAIAAVLRRVVDEAAVVTGRRPRTAVLTYPAAWSTARRRTLRLAARHAGLVANRLVAEPEAAAWYLTEVHRLPLPPGATMVVYDLGAGTFDATLVERTTTGVRVRAVAGLDVGGLDLDAVILAHLQTLYGPRDSAAWERLANPTTDADREHRRDLDRDIRAVKERLSRAPDAALDIPTLDVRTHLTREEFERLARPVLDRTVAVTKRLIADAVPAPADLAWVFLVGGSSRIPLVTTLLHRELGNPPVVTERPELVVAEGGLLVPAPEPDLWPGFDPPGAEKTPVANAGTRPEGLRPTRMLALTGALILAAVLVLLAIVRVIGGPDVEPDRATPASTTTAPPTPPLTFPPPGWPLRLKDPLTAAGNWQNSPFSDANPGACWFAAGRTLRYDGNPPRPPTWLACDGPRDAPPLADLAIEVTLTLERDACAGVYFGADAPGSGRTYVYKICGDGDAELLRLGDGPEPVKVTAAGVKVGPGRPHRIGVAVIGDQVRLHVDGGYVKAATDNRVGRGYYGLGGFTYANDFTVTYFSDFSLWSA